MMVEYDMGFVLVVLDRVMVLVDGKEFVIGIVVEV